MEEKLEIVFSSSDEDQANFDEYLNKCHGKRYHSLVC